MGVCLILILGNEYIISTEPIQVKILTTEHKVKIFNVTYWSSWMLFCVFLWYEDNEQSCAKNTQKQRIGRKLSIFIKLTLARQMGGALFLGPRNVYFNILLNCVITSDKEMTGGRRKKSPRKSEKGTSRQKWVPISSFSFNFPVALPGMPKGTNLQWYTVQRLSIYFEIHKICWICNKQIFQVKIISACKLEKCSYCLLAQRQGTTWQQVEGEYVSEFILKDLLHFFEYFSIHSPSIYASPGFGRWGKHWNTTLVWAIFWAGHWQKHPKNPNCWKNLSIPMTEWWMVLHG